MTAPVYSVESECRDCYSCVRHCPVKAIKVVNDHATVTPDACILCGHCVAVCAHNAKRVRDDLPRAKELIETGAPAWVSLAPSYIAEFPEVRPAQMSSALKMLGFAGCAETAEGASRVSQEVAKILETAKSGVYISTACPVVVELVRKYFPKLVPCLTPVLPPMLAHARILKERYGAKTPVVFVGPCIGKKRDADEEPDLLYAALTYKELRAWLKEKGIEPKLLDDDPAYVPPCEGSLYPVLGGMNETIRYHLHRRDLDGSLLTISDITNIRRQFEQLDTLKFSRPVFLETLACAGGCIAGPASASTESLAAREKVVAYANGTKKAEASQAAIGRAWTADPVGNPEFTEDQIWSALHRVGKYAEDDCLNCGGCGYSNCRSFARALLRGVAEEKQCVTYMRQLAQKKSNAIAQALPYGMVLVDDAGLIVEANRRFAELLGESATLAFDADPGMKGAEFAKTAPFAHLFTEVLRGDVESVRRNVKAGEKIFSVSVFPVTPRRLVCGLVLDITAQEKNRQELVEKSQQMIRATTKTVQEIAYRLGKNAAESEIVLNSLMGLYGSAEETETAPEDSQE